VINAENGRVFDELIPDSRLVILEDVGHAPMLESPKTSASLVADFVLSLRPESRAPGRGDRGSRSLAFNPNHALSDSEGKE